MAPPIHRFPMAYQPRIAKGSVVGLNNTVFLRRLIIFILLLASAGFGAHTMTAILSPQGLTTLKWAIIGVFTLLFGWISLTFWTALMGFILLMLKYTPFTASTRLDREIPESISVAVVMPVYNEDTARIFAGLQTMYKSLQKTGELGHFYFFILSDSDDPNHWQEEEAMWARLCRETEGADRIFYRRRKLRIHKKSGNIADFCRRWGVEYQYMIALDADSLMSGRLMTDMVKIMEERPKIGILQTAPKGINQNSLISRINQFTSYSYGALLIAGSSFWQMDEAGFWGHNAIIRLEPFMKYCVLPKLAGSPPFGGEILSHDFVEAALMRRAGWDVWLAYDLTDSYEELPPDLLEELERDCRWCRGNIQHLRLIFMKGISLGHRLLFLNGNMFYFSSLLWFVMLVLMTAYAISDFFHKTQYFPFSHSLFPQWPVQYRHLSMELLTVTIIFLFLPKVLAVLWIFLSGRARLFGGTARLCMSVLGETFFSILLAPIKMIFHSWFLLTAMTGGKFDWKRQLRSSQKTSFRRAFKAHWAGSLMALIWAVTGFEVNGNLFLWLLVIVFPLFLSIPISMVLSSSRAGELFRKWGFFLTPQETSPSTL
jgi:membrane glycosyltransferase